MKKNFLKQNILFMASALLALSLSLGFSSCSNDDEPEDSNPIVGTWRFTTATAEVESNSERNDGLIRTYVVAGATGRNQGAVWTFRANGTFEISGANAQTGSYTFANDVLTLNGVPHNVSINNNVLTVAVDITEDFQNPELDKLIRIGITDIFTGFEVSKVIERINFTRQ